MPEAKKKGDEATPSSGERSSPLSFPDAIELAFLPFPYQFLT
jgi:hypothetical protein